MKNKTGVKVLPLILVCIMIFIQLMFFASQFFLLAKFHDSEYFQKENTIELRNKIIAVSPLIIYVTCALLVGLSLGSLQVITFRKLISGMEKLAEGQYDVRISHKHRLSFYNLEAVEDTFNRLAKELGNTELLRKDFINSFSHEFKTPISSIKGFAKLLQDKGLSEEERENYTNIIYNEAERLTQLSENMLFLCNIENQEIVNNEHLYNLSEQVRQCILLLEPMWSKKNIDFSIQLEEIEWNKNEDFIKQMIINIISNAIKFSYDYSSVDVNLYKKEDRVIFSVKDYGIGMNEEIKDKMFLQFFQGDKTHHTNGSGIGLSIVKQICELYNAEIAVSSKPEQGTEVVISMVY